MPGRHAKALHEASVVSAKTNLSASSRLAAASKLSLALQHPGQGELKLENPQRIPNEQQLVVGVYRHHDHPLLPDRRQPLVDALDTIAEC